HRGYGAVAGTGLRPGRPGELAGHRDRGGTANRDAGGAQRGRGAQAAEECLGHAAARGAGERGKVTVRRQRICNDPAVSAQVSSRRKPRGFGGTRLWPSSPRMQDRFRNGDRYPTWVDGRFADSRKTTVRVASTARE